jgi:outer membrane murein-binding lipoprotein Lpp
MKSIVHGTAIALAVVGVMGLSGCSSYAVPNTKVASSEAAIRAAQETGSRDVPQAALHLKLAEEQLEQAKKLIRNDDNERASYVLSRAEADAELALALSRAQGSKSKAGTALDNVRAVRSGAPTP